MRSIAHFIVLLNAILLPALFSNVLAQIGPESLRQINLLLQEKASRTPAERKIHSELLQASREFRGKKMVEGVQLRPAEVNADEKGNLDVDIKADVTDALIEKIKDLGGIIIYPSKKYHTLRARISFSMIDSIATFPEVEFIQPAAKARTVGSGIQAAYTIAADASTIISPARPSFAERAQHVSNILESYLDKRSNLSLNSSTGPIVSEGDHTHGADSVRNIYGYTGKGIRIGVISDSYNEKGGAATDIANGDLPGTTNPYGYTTPVTTVQDYLHASATDEGRAMLQIVHDLAPDAQLFFATADVSEAGFADNINTLRNAPNKCDIIIDDVAYFDEPVFEDGIIAQAVDAVTANGALYFSAAGNDGALTSNSAGVFEGDFNASGSASFTKDSKTGTIHNFGTISSPINGDIIESQGNAYILYWADPLGASSNDYDLFILNSAGNVVSSSTDIQNGTQDPIEELNTVSNFVAGDRLVVFKTSGAAVRAFNINTLGGVLADATTGQTHGHCCAANAFDVAATPAANAFSNGNPTGPYPGVFISSDKVELFSSDGPRRIFFNPDSTAITPGNFLFGTNGGSLLQKPDITAADGVSTDVSGTTEFSPYYYGTSAAAPHAGAIAALLKQAAPSLTVSQMKSILTSTALDIEAGGYDGNSGYGIIQAFQAMRAINPTPLANIILDTDMIKEDSVSNDNGAIDPGEIGDIKVQLLNPSLATATNVLSIITTTTPGVTIVQDSANYGTIGPSGTANNTFNFTVSPTITCGTIINFFDTVYFNGGGPSPQIFMFTTVVGSQPDMNINSDLGAIPPTGINYTSATGSQTGRINRNTVGQVSSCATPLTNPGLLASSTAPRDYDAYKFTNTSANSQCVTVTMSSIYSDSLFCVAYNDSGFVPSNPSHHFLADGGNSFSPEEYSFNVAAQDSFTVVVNAVNASGSVGDVYNLDVALEQCSVIYTFIGNGNWDVASNWTNNTIPPATITSGSEIIINPIANGECILNVSQTVSSGGIITVESGKKFRILSDLNIQN
jgi:hypothetical protein